MLKECRLRELCKRGGCSKRHHQLLHDALVSDNKHEPQHSVVTSTNCNWDVLLGVIPVKVQSEWGSEITYALLDPGSQVTLVKDSLVKKLNLNGGETRLAINTALGCSIIGTKEIEITLNSIDGIESIEIPRAFVVRDLPVTDAPDLPISTISKWHHLRDIELPVAQNKEITLLIGSDVPEVHWVIDQRIRRKKEPYAVRGILGWIVRGPLCENTSEGSFVNCISKSCGVESLIERLYNEEFEDLAKPGLLSQNDIRATELVNASTYYADGHYTIGLPWKVSPSLLPNNKNLARNRLRCLKSRLMKDSELCAKYHDVMNNYIVSGYAAKVEPGRLDARYLPRWYLPHHPVMNPKKPDKLRIVFVCAADYQGWSLNKCSLSGPNVVNDLVGVILRFREGYVAVEADIKKMFLQV